MFELFWVQTWLGVLSYEQQSQNAVGTHSCRITPQIHRRSDPSRRHMWLMTMVIGWLAPPFITDHWFCLLCRFVSTFGSTFSANVNRIRGYHSSCLVPDKGIYFVNWPTNEARLHLTRTTVQWRLAHMLAQAGTSRSMRRPLPGGMTSKAETTHPRMSLTLRMQRPYSCGLLRTPAPAG